jgi:anti-anti-sigma factor
VVDEPQSQDVFRAEITTHHDGAITLELFGELDLVSMPQFEAALAEVLMRKPRRVIFDLSAARFISGQGFAAIGRCSNEAEVAIRSGSGLALKILRALGYDEVECIDTGPR